MSNCFLCLEKSKNRICTTCTCCGHSSCWGKYLQNINKVETYITENSVIIKTAWSIKCPQCRQKIMRVKSITRSDTELARSIAILEDYISFLEIIEYVNTEDELHKLCRNVLDALLVHKILIKKNEQLVFLLKRQLSNLYMDGWKAANMYHHKFFGIQIV